MFYHCPVCHKVSPNAKDLARHIMGTGNKEHRGWIESKCLSFQQLGQGLIPFVSKAGGLRGEQFREREAERDEE